MDKENKKKVVGGIAILVITAASLIIWLFLDFRRDSSASKDQIPVTAGSNAPLNPLQDLVENVQNGQQDAVRGVFSSGVMSFPVVQQPEGDPDFVSREPGVVTQFRLPKDFDVIGLLAHNNLAGEMFFELEAGDIVKIIYGDAHVEDYEIQKIRDFRALEPNDPHSDFVDLNTGERIGDDELFQMMYVGDHHLTLQVSIRRGEIEAWGRRFIIAEMVEEK